MNYLSNLTSHENVVRLQGYTLAIEIRTPFVREKY